MRLRTQAGNSHRSGVGTGPTDKEIKTMNLLTTEQQKELDRWYTKYSVVNKRRPSWNELCKKAEEIMKKN